MKKVFLGGTCNGSTWRDELIPLLNIGYFNPVTSDWDEAAKAEELHQRATCDYVLYVINSRMAGYYSIAEAVDDSNKRPEKTLFCVLFDTPGLIQFSKKEKNSLQAISDLILRNGSFVFNSLEDVALYLNHA